MDGSSYALLITVTLAASAFTGCIANPLEALRAETEVSAFENKAAADEAAFAWDPKATLIGAMSFELSESPDPRIEADPSVGNGLAPAWWYIYRATDARAPETEKSEDGGMTRATGSEEKTVSAVQVVRAFKVSADGTVTSEDDAAMMAEGFDHEGEAIVGWELDSTAMIDAAKQNETFRKVAEGVNATVIEGVATYEGKTTFFATAMSAAGWVSAVLDAATGQVIEIKEMTMDFQMPTFEYGANGPQAWMAEPVHLEGADTSNAGDEMMEHPFSLVGSMRGELTIDFTTAGPMDGLHWGILDEEGELIQVDHLRAWDGSGRYETELEIEDAGDYTFVIGYMESYPTAPAPILLPLGGAVEYAFTLHLEPGRFEMPDKADG